MIAKKEPPKKDKRMNEDIFLFFHKETMKETLKAKENV